MKFLFFILSVTSISVETFATESFVKTQWSLQDESLQKKALLFVPRLIEHPLEILATGKTAHRLENSARGSVKLIQSVNDPKNAEPALHLLASGITNPLGDVNSISADAIAMIASPLSATSKMSKRIQVCSVAGSEVLFGHELNDTLAYTLSFIDPIHHEALVIDDYFETSDAESYSGAVKDSVKGLPSCRKVPLKNNESESIAIERLYCLSDDKNFSPEYNFLRYNCGGYTHDLLKMAGLGYTDHSNLDIGLNVFSSKNPEQKIWITHQGFKKKMTIAEVNELYASERAALQKRMSKKEINYNEFYVLDKNLEKLFLQIKRPQQLAYQRAQIKKTCGHHIDKLRETIFALEAGVDVPSLGDFELPLSPDALLQYVISVARAKNLSNRDLIVSTITNEKLAFLKQTEKFSKSAQKTWKKMREDLDAESREWLRVHYSIIE